jgi:hypothetical protein
MRNLLPSDRTTIKFCAPSSNKNRKSTSASRKGNVQPPAREKPCFPVCPVLPNSCTCTLACLRATRQTWNTTNTLVPFELEYSSTAGRKYERRLALCREGEFPHDSPYALICSHSAFFFLSERTVSPNSEMVSSQAFEVVLVAGIDAKKKSNCRLSRSQT